MSPKPILRVTLSCLLLLFLNGRAYSAAPGAKLEVAQLQPADAPLQRPPARVVAGQQDVDVLFPRYGVLAPNVSFWTQVFGAIPDTHSVVHSTVYPDLILETLDFGAEAAILNKDDLRQLRNQREREATGRIKIHLERIHEARHAPETLRGEERRLYTLFAHVDDADRFQKAADSLRSQRGIKSRTHRALEISGRYMPYMESVFESYGLPKQLTRLPLVESSFNVDAYSKVGAAGLWQFIPSSARVYMRLNKIVDDRRDPWLSTDAAARHLRDDFRKLQSWPLALTAYNFGRAGVARGLEEIGGTTLEDLINRYEHRRFGFASRNFYAEFLAAFDVERDWRLHFGEVLRDPPLQYDQVQTRHYVPYDTLRRISRLDAEQFRQFNPAYKPQVLAGKLYVPPGHAIKVPSGHGQAMEVAYAGLDQSQVFSKQRVNHFYHRVTRGQTLSGIASRYGVSQSSIRANNRIGRKGVIRIGQRLKIVPQGGVDAMPTIKQAAAAPKKPQYSIHKVSSGQTLSAISRRYGVPVAEIRRVNGLGRSSLIKVGQRLKVPK
tara:strand:+ start:4055 stop:5704 length:1650 start_codon:yes stop_codon:yes gene_type:complete